MAGEQVLPLPPLPLPAPVADHTGPSVALFLERAGAVAPELGGDEETSPVVGELVRRLDGLPLAIELRGPGRTLSARDLRDRLGEQIDLLAHTARRRTATAR